MPIPVDGPYYVGIGSSAHQVYCDMTREGGGWTLLMKMAGTGDTFVYDSPYWETTLTLNPTDITLDDADSKYSEFNTAEITKLMARWPADGAMQELLWIVGPFAPTVALEFFQTPLVLSSTPRSEPNWDGGRFSSQDGAQLYSVAHSGLGSPASVRWGYSWNNEVSCPNDAFRPSCVQTLNLVVLIRVTGDPTTLSGGSD